MKLLTSVLLILLSSNVLHVVAQEGPAPLPSAPRGPLSSGRVQEVRARLPLSFEANMGQTDSRVKFLARGPGYNLFLTSDEVLVSAHDGSPALSIRLAGARRQREVTGLEELPGRSNYFFGSDPRDWRTKVALYKKVRYKGVYPGVDLIYYGNQRELEYDFHLAPGANPKRIRLAFRGARAVSVDRTGELVLQTDRGETRHRRPVIYQDVNGVRRQVPGRYVMRGRFEAGFEVDTYDRLKPLVIDPVLIYSSYLGGGDWDFGDAIAVDAAGAIYVTGWTSSVNFPTKNSIQPPPTPDPFRPSASTRGADVFVTKIDPSSTGEGSLVYSTYIGGTGNDEARAIAVDGAGNAYIAGWTNSYNIPGTAEDEAFPVSAGAFQRGLYLPRFGVPTDGFVAKLSPSGDALLYSTYFGGG
jgi:hypothetical protein